VAKLHLSSLSKRYGSFFAVDNISLDVEEGEFIVLLGPSGCGKTTTLRMIAGFVEPTTGSITIGGKDQTFTPTYRRNLGIVFQNYAVFPHLNVFENVAFGLRRRKQPKQVIDTKTIEALKRVKLDHLGDRLPRQLSGGQQQRVAIARALAIEPDVLLLDEPLSNLDAKLRQEVRLEIHRLQRDLGITTVMVTHDQEEALSLGDRLVVIDKGKVQQIGPPQEIYERPANLFVAGFIGRTNVMQGGSSGTHERMFVTNSNLRLLCRNSATGTSSVVIRPEAIRIHREARAGLGQAMVAIVNDVTYQGAVCEVRLQLAPAEVLTASIASLEAARLHLAPGESVFLEIPPESAYALPTH
jgi:putative spermidine/putrescine transport system ATP-binding protein